jgi:hypothetical protein
MGKDRQSCSHQIQFLYQIKRALHLNTPAAKYPFQFFDIIPNRGKAMDWQKQMNRAMEYI